MERPASPDLTPRLEELFEEQAHRSPDRAAIYYEGAVVTYGQLKDTVDRNASILSDHGVRPGVIVGVSLARTPFLITSLLAILRAGGAYLPLDPDGPPERTRFMLEDSGCGLVLADRRHEGLVGFGGTLLEVSASGVRQGSLGPRPMASAPQELAYVIYTSGSTGRPKGVMLGHGAVHLIRWAEQYYSAEDRSRVAATTALSFDPSVLEIFMPLALGGALILKPNALAPFRAGEAPTLLNTTPSVLVELCRADALPPSLRILNVGGEVLHRDLVDEVQKRRPGLRVDNHYGPTEATTVATVARVSGRDGGEPSIGKAVRGAEIRLTDAQGAPVADGEVGEIRIGGAALALGYLNQPDLTHERFVEGAWGRAYRTGDLGFWRDGELRFAGRMDQQVKIQGVRIELAEIEQALMRLPHIETAVVKAHAGAKGGRLIAYVQSRVELRPDQVRKALRRWLPNAMLPAQIVRLDQLPRLPSGKIDHARLPDPEEVVRSATTGRLVKNSRMERPIIHVFEEVLSREGLGPNDNFFDLGGDSLASVRAALQLEEILGFELPAALIHQAPTARSLARSLVFARPGAERHLSRLHAGGDGRPLFCLADLFGQPFNYLSLARRLGARRPVFGVSPGPLQAAFMVDGDIARLTQGYADEILAVRPQGPWLIAGYSAGGLLALELARILERRGGEVRLILLDATRRARRPSLADLVHWTVKHLKIQIRNAYASAAPASPRLPALARRSWLSWIPRSQVAYAARLIRASARHQAGTFGGAALVLRVAQRDPVDEVFDTDGLMGWATCLRGPVTVISVEGDHHSFLREPRVSQAAAAIEHFLAGVASDPSGAIAADRQMARTTTPLLKSTEF